MISEKKAMRRKHEVAGRKRSGKNGATLGLKAVQRNRKRAAKAKVAKQQEADDNG